MKMVTGTELYAEENDPIKRKKLKIPERGNDCKVDCESEKGEGLPNRWRVLPLPRVGGFFHCSRKEAKVEGTM